MNIIYKKKKIFVLNVNMLMEYKVYEMAIYTFINNLIILNQKLMNHLIYNVHIELNIPY